MNKSSRSSEEQRFEELIKEEIAKIDPETLQYIEQYLAESQPAVQSTQDEQMGDEEIDLSALQSLEREITKIYYSSKFVPLEELEKTRTEEEYQKETQKLYEAKIVGTTFKGRHYIRWSLIRDLEKDLTPEFMEKIRENVETSFFCRHNYSIKLRNIEDDTVIIYHQQSKGSPWIKKFSEAEEWLSEQEKKRLEGEKIERPTTKWLFEGFHKVEVKVVLDRQPLLGTGPLPDWLRNLARGRAGPMVALDTYRDNLCLWRCIAVHRGALPH